MQGNKKSTQELQRDFCDISDEILNLVEYPQLRRQLGINGALNWDKLLESYRVLIISEAGSGKTYECKRAQERLWKAGQPAYFLELAELAKTDLNDQLDSSEITRFELWQSSQTDVATFFLDSVDELQLTHGSFTTALKRLEKRLSKNLHRARIVITTRPIPFDRDEFIRILPVPEKNQDANLVDIYREESFARIASGQTYADKQARKKQTEVPVWRHVCLMPLSIENIHEIARSQGVENTSELLKAIHQQNLDDFTHRPLDLIALCIDWREHQQIHALRKQLENNILVKLKPRDDRDELTALSPEKALDGASKLALACLLSKKLTIRHSSESDQVASAEDALDPSTILTDWNEKERKTLLERALFGFSNYGRVRFHHRSVIEFLSAKQFNNLLQAGMTIKSLKRLLFAETPQGIKVIRPNLRPTSAWLAASNESILQEVLEREPEVLLNFADPESLSMTNRCRALKTYVERHKDGNWRGLHVPRLQVHRMANQELAPLILELWNTNIENPEVRELLVEIIEVGKISECSDIAYSLAINQAAEISERLASIRALIILDDTKISKVIEDMLSHTQHWPDQLIKLIIVDCFPNQLSAEQVGTLLRNVYESSNEIGDLRWRWPKVIAEADITSHSLEQLRQTLSDLVLENAKNSRTELIDKTSRTDLLNALAAVCLRLFTDNCFDEAVLNSSILALHFSEHHHSSEKEPISELKKALNFISPKIREKFFFTHLTFIQDFYETESSHYQFHHLYRESSLQYNVEQDEGWVKDNLVSKSLTIETRVYLLRLILSIQKDIPNIREKCLRDFRPLVSDSEELSKHLEDYSKQPRMHPEQLRWEKQAKEAEEKTHRREAKNRASWIALHRDICNSPEEAFNRERRWDTAWNLWQAASNDNHENDTPWNRPFIEKYFNKELADRLRLVLMEIWRKEMPTLRGERQDEEKHKYFPHLNFALSGIYAESEDPTWARNLSNEEALVAARFLPQVLNGLPEWFQSLASAHPTAIKSILGSELSSELTEICDTNSYFRILQQLQKQPPTIIELFKLILLQHFSSISQLREGDNENSACERLKLVVQLLTKCDDEATKILISDTAKNSLMGELETPFAFVWVSALLLFSPLDAVIILEKSLIKSELTENASAIKWIAQLFGKGVGERLFTLTSIQFTPEILLRLVRFAYIHVDPKTDPIHRGSYTPDVRDNAKRGRDALLSVILNQTSSDAWSIKQEVIKDPLFVDFKDRILFLATESAATETDSRIFDSTEISTLYKDYESPPTTSEELFKMMIDNLDDLEDVLLQDDSQREIWQLIQDEKLMRRAISRELRLISKNNYFIIQEAVTAEEKETDIRIKLRDCDLEGVIELKLGDGRSGRDLRDTLNEQIVKKYLAPRNRRVGCLLVTVNSEKHWDHPDTNDSLDISGLRRMLEEHTRQVIEESGWSLKIAVKVLDLRPRLPTEKMLKKKID